MNPSNGDRVGFSSEQVAEAYIDLRRRVVALLRHATPTDGDLVVPHCPDWTVQQLASHIIGVPEDIMAGRMEGVTTEDWTQAQVDRHRGQTLAELADLYEQSDSDFDPVLKNIPAPVNAQLVMDAVSHEHDLRYALQQPGERDSVAVKIAGSWLCDRAIEHLGKQVVDENFGLLDDFEMLRTLSGRRSLEQLVALGLKEEIVEGLFSASPLKPSSKTISE